MWQIVPGDERADRAPATEPSRVSTTTATTAATTTLAPTTTVPAGPPFAVGVTKFTVEDPSRGTRARGATPATSSRKLPLTVHYPTTGSAGVAVVENAPSASGTYPLLVFAHGYAITAADYDPLTRDLAAAGFIVVAPDFPLSSLIYPGPPTQSDMPEQALDVSFVINVFQTPSSLPAVLQGHVAATKVSIVGHSDGGATVAATSGHSCCLDARVGASVALAGDQGGFFRGAWFQPAAAPQLFIHGTADADVPFGHSRKLYEDTVVTKMLVSVTNGVHWDPFVSSATQRPVVIRLVVDFLRAHALGDAAARSRLVADANADGVLRLEASA